MFSIKSEISVHHLINRILKNQDGSSTVKAFVAILVFGLIFGAISTFSSALLRQQEKIIRQIEYQKLTLLSASHVIAEINDNSILESITWDVGSPTSDDFSLPSIDSPERLISTIGSKIQPTIRFTDNHALINTNSIPKHWLNTVWLGTMLKAGVSYEEFDEFRQSADYFASVESYSTLISESWLEFITNKGIINPNFSDPPYLSYVLVQMGLSNLNPPPNDGSFITSSEQISNYWSVFGVSDPENLLPAVGFLPVVSLTHAPEKILSAILQAEGAFREFMYIDQLTNQLISIRNSDNLTEDLFTAEIIRVVKASNPDMTESELQTKVAPFNQLLEIEPTYITVTVDYDYPEIISPESDSDRISGFTLTLFRITKGERSTWIPSEISLTRES